VQRQVESRPSGQRPVRADNLTLRRVSVRVPEAGLLQIDLTSPPASWPFPRAGAGRRLVLARLLLATVAGCSGPPRLPAVPSDLTNQVMVLNTPNARFWADTQGPAMVQEALRALARERALQDTAPRDLVPASFLALSGGGDNGAFGAGLLVGWTETGTRPSFNLVTGISAGALIAPFAFLGPRYDAQLRAVFTQVGPHDIYIQRWLPAAIFNDALASTAPLFGLISRYVDQHMLGEIAREYQKGRLLLIGTTNIDEQRPVIWNIGAIAASGQPGALDLFRKILLASASIPGLFPPVMIDVSVGGQHYQEMHVDGGAVAQTFLIPKPVGELLDLRSRKLARKRTAFIIRNARLDPDWASINRRVLSIAGRAIETMIHYGGYNDVIRIYFASQRDGIDFNLAFIGEDFTQEHATNFDTAYMRALFDYGRAKALSGSAWVKRPPIFSQPDGEESLGVAGVSSAQAGKVGETALQPN
jgi:hypothetical protein